MSTRTLAVELPQSLYERLARVAEVSHRPMERVVLQTLSSALPPLPEDFSDDTRRDLAGLEALDDGQLWKQARAVLAPAKQREMARLLDRNSANTITEQERATLGQLRLEADQIMLRKAYAAVLLKWRSAPLASPADLRPGNKP
jgi:predicted transcriptional regulator